MKTWMTWFGVGADAPIACTLAPAAMAQRLADLRRLNAQHLRSHRLEGRTLHLAYAPEAAAEVERIVALERDCCAFLEFETASREGRCELRIVAPAGQGADALLLFAQFLPDGGEEPRGCACGCG
jgi:hypothetical protein